MMFQPAPTSALFPYTTLFRSNGARQHHPGHRHAATGVRQHQPEHGDIVEVVRSEEHTSELQSRFDLVCRLLLEKKNTTEFIAPLVSFLQDSGRLFFSHRAPAF